MYNSNISRRQLIMRLGALGAGAYLSSFFACGERTSKLAFYGTGTLDIGEQGWQKLASELGIELTFKDNGNDTGPVITQMITGTAATDYDLGGLQGGAERELARAGRILPWELSLIPAWSTMWELARQIAYTKVDGAQFGLPLALNADSMVYRPDLLAKVQGFEHYGDVDVDTYAVLFDPRLRGKTSMEDAWINSVIFAAIYLKENNLTQISDPSDLTDTELKEVMTFLIDKKKSGHFVKLWNGWEQGVDLVKSGAVIIMTGWEPIVYELQRLKVPAKYAIPREGYEGWSNDLLLHAGTKSKGTYQAAHRVANWLLSGYYGCRLSDLRGYVVPNDGTLKYAQQSGLISPKKITEINDHVKAKFRTGRGYWQNVRPREYRLYEEWWSRLRAA